SEPGTTGGLDTALCGPGAARRRAPVGCRRRLRSSLRALRAVQWSSPLQPADSPPGHPHGSGQDPGAAAAASAPLLAGTAPRAGLRADPAAGYPFPAGGVQPGSSLVAATGAAQALSLRNTRGP